MKKEILSTLLCAGLILVTPFTTIAQENKISSNLIEQPYIEGLVAQIRTVVNEILQKYGHIPIVRNLCNHILGILDNPIIKVVCILLLIISIPIQALLLLLAFIFWDYALVFWGWMLLIATTWDLECAPYFTSKSIQPLKTISILTVKNDFFKIDCPCLQL